MLHGRIPLLIFFFLLTLPGCITDHDLVKQSGSSSKLAVDAAKINGLYKNRPDTTRGITLWGGLFDCWSFKRDTTKAAKTSLVRLRLDSLCNLHVTLMDSSSKVLNSIILKAKLNGKYLFIRRNFFLIPFPFIYCHYREAKAALYLKDNETLGMSYSRSQFVWILVAGNVDQNFNCSYKKQGN